MPRYVILDPSADSPETGECSSHTLNCHFACLVTEEQTSANDECTRFGYPTNVRPTQSHFEITSDSYENTHEKKTSNRNRDVSNGKAGGVPTCYGEAEDDFIVSCTAMSTECDDYVSIQRHGLAKIGNESNDGDGKFSNSENYQEIFLEDKNTVSCAAGNDENTIFSEKRRLLVNSRERDRMKRLNEAMDRLRKVVPHYPSRKKLSKMETLLMAQNYILALTNLLQQEEAGEGGCRDAEKLAASITKTALKNNTKF